MKTVRIAAAQTAEFREDIEAALHCGVEAAARAEVEGASLLCFPEGFLQGYLTEEAPARRNALDLASPAFRDVLKRLPKTGPMIVMGLIEVEAGRLFNSAIVVDRGILVGRYRKAHLFSGEHIFNAGSDNQLRLFGGENCFDAGSDSPVFEVDGLRFGINICYDTNFPEAARKVADVGASLIVCPANNMCRRKTAEALKDAHNAIRWRASCSPPRSHANKTSALKVHDARLVALMNVSGVRQILKYNTDDFARFGVEALQSSAAAV